REELFAVIGGSVKDHRASLLAAGGVEDHVHLLLRTHPSFTIADTIQRLKSNSSHWINHERKIDAKFHWQRGYGAFSVSQSMVDPVKSYINRQAEHHRKQAFKDEYLALLSKHRIKYNAQYVFDQEHVG
ncbi:MAG: transposase, partial [Planctomycetota bacterium]